MPGTPTKEPLAFAFSSLKWIIPVVVLYGGASTAASESFDVTGKRIEALSQGGAEWLSYGRDYSEQRFSPLRGIDETNVGRLGLTGYIDLGENRGQEATPLMVDGVLFTSLSWSKVMAADAVTGKVLWTYDPQVPKGKAIDACCDSVNRGVAVWEGKVFIGTLDGRLVALNARTGELIWQKQTTDPSQAYTITGAPRVVKGKVIIGNSGGDYGTRGYFSAYDATSGEMIWRFYVVPGDPSKPYEHPELAEAAKTWTGDVYWKYGGGGNPWDGIAYDPDLDLLYVGTGNGSPWNREVRSPGGGDNLYLSSILAVRPDTGKLVWYYQETPGDSWDFTSTQQITLADLEIDGRKRRTLLHAPKNGFFYVLDRATGELLSAEKFGKVTWADRIDLKTGRPVEHPEARYLDKPVVQWPSGFGAHNWHPMSYSPLTGLVYIPYHEVPGALRNQAKEFVFRPHRLNTGNGFSDAREFPKEAVSGALLAWDPVAQKARWRVPHKSHYNGGVLSTAGNLVFQGTAAGHLVAYSADKGEALWDFDAQTGIVAGPMSYEVNGEQYLAVMAGWGGAAATVGGEAAQVEGRRNISRLLIFKIGGTASLPPKAKSIESADLSGSGLSMAINASTRQEDVDEGAVIYANNCLVCHGVGAVSGGLMPDLRKVDPTIYDSMEAIVLGGALEDQGMPNFGKYLLPADVEKIKAYIVSRRKASFGTANSVKDASSDAPASPQ
ncbi:PQQ-dependent dehydrogenase, methanol/ethanol family [Azospirillum sp. Sh1]|uniref:PQQ-dependent dehydrogenase, methanol/ethanol family n=1 Tax=Azospirillum sp. Sh1 TaxID=2607285 RepID=UPI0011EDF9B9|nr:PQQ-dependent dehydrogenase, methanol/ethanol family [Azospirillum sp. Sh1]KAA0571529.1 PQQ-dependent dehydrogenase, methanol/ethanol family [Azospirillum sp. Sh1]